MMYINLKNSLFVLFLVPFSCHSMYRNARRGQQQLKMVQALRAISFKVDARPESYRLKAEETSGPASFLLSSHEKSDYFSFKHSIKDPDFLSMPKKQKVNSLSLGVFSAICSRLAYANACHPLPTLPLPTKRNFSTSISDGTSEGSHAKSQLQEYYDETRREVQRIRKEKLDVIQISKNDLERSLSSLAYKRERSSFLLYTSLFGEKIKDLSRDFLRNHDFRKVNRELVEFFKHWIVITRYESLLMESILLQTSLCIELLKIEDILLDPGFPVLLTSDRIDQYFCALNVTSRKLFSKLNDLEKLWEEDITEEMQEAIKICREKLEEIERCIAFDLQLNVLETFLMNEKEMLYRCALRKLQFYRVHTALVWNLGYKVGKYIPYEFLLGASGVFAFLAIMETSAHPEYALGFSIIAGIMGFLGLQAKDHWIKLNKYGELLIKMNELLTPHFGPVRYLAAKDLMKGFYPFEDIEKALNLAYKLKNEWLRDRY